MNSRPQHVRVKTGPTVGSTLVAFFVEVIVLGLKFGIVMLRGAAKASWWLIVNVVVPGVRVAAQSAARLATSIAGRVSARRGDES